MKECTKTRGRKDRGWVVVGPGAIGILFGVKLYESGLQVAFQIKSRQELSLYRKHGLTLRENQKETRIKPKFFSAGSPPPFVPQYVLLSVKAYQTREALKPLLEFLPDDTFYITVQNGLKPLEDLKKLVSPKKIVLGVTTEGATRTSPGVSERKGKGITFLFSPFNPESQWLDVIRESMDKAGLKAIIPENGWKIYWQKLVVSLSVNPITALLGVKNGELTYHSEGIELIRTVIREALQVIERMGTPLRYEETIEFVFETIKKTSENRSSMLQDIESRRPTEIDAISGEFVRKARSLGIETPAIETLYRLIRLREKSLGIEIL